MMETPNKERKQFSVRSHLKLCRANDETDKNFKRKNKQNETKRKALDVDVDDVVTVAFNFNSTQ